MIRDIHLTCVDVSNIYKTIGIPRVITYPVWFIFLFVNISYKKIKKWLK